MLRENDCPDWQCCKPMKLEAIFHLLAEHVWNAHLLLYQPISLSDSHPMKSMPTALGDSLYGIRAVRIPSPLMKKPPPHFLSFHLLLCSCNATCVERRPETLPIWDQCHTVFLCWMFGCCIDALVSGVCCFSAIGRDPMKNSQRKSH